MYKLDLVYPVILSEEIDRIAEATGFSSDRILRLAGGEVPPLGIVTADNDLYKKFDLVPMQIRAEDEPPKAKIVLTGPLAVIWLCLQKGVIPCFLTRIDIPDDLFSDCSANRWHDISSLYYRVSTMNDCIARLAALRAPEIILRHEIKLLWEAADALEYGMDGGPWGLSTSGYSLIYGWLDDADTTPGDEDTDFFE